MQRDQQDEDRLRVGSAHGSRGGTSHSRGSRNRYDSTDDDYDIYNAVGSDFPNPSPELRPPSSSHSSRSGGSPAEESSASRQSLHLSLGKGGTASRPQSKSSSRPSSSHSRTESSPYKSKFAASLFGDSRPSTGINASSSATQVLSDHSASPPTADEGTPGRPLSKQSRTGSRPPSSSGHSSSRPGSSSSKGSVSRKGGVSKWDTSHQTKQETTAALRQQGSSCLMSAEDSQEEDSQEQDSMDEGGFLEHQYEQLQVSEHHSEVAPGGSEEGGFLQHQYEQADESIDEGFDQYGYDQYGFDQYGYDKQGFDHYGYNQEGYDADGKLYEEGEKAAEIET